MKSIISMHNIDFFYKTQYEVVNIFNNFNLDIKENEYVVITGKSGSGKSTLLNLIAGFSSPQKGKILVNDKEVNKMSEKEINQFHNKELGYVFQDFNLIYQFTVLENVMTPLLIAGIDKKEASKKVTALLEKFELKKRKNHYPNELSGGEQQRVAIARAIVNNPYIILADEPTGNLDNVTGNQILDLLDEIHKEGKTIILVTHDLEITQRATRVIDIKEIITHENLSALC